MARSTDRSMAQLSQALRHLALFALLTRGLSPMVAQNLVPNGSFEEYEVCPNVLGFQPGDQPAYWRSWSNTPEYFHACAGQNGDVDTLIDVPVNGWTTQSAFDGSGYVGLYAYQDDETYREHVGITLQQPLVVGQQYHVRFRANLASNGTYWYTNGASNRLGVLFTMQSNEWESSIDGPAFLPRNYAHLFSNDLLTDTVDWTLVEGDFVADSAYQHMVIGNFFDNFHTSSVSFLGPEAVVLAYYLIDSVSVQADGTVGWTNTAEREDGLGFELDQVNGSLRISSRTLEFLTVEFTDVLGRPTYGPVEGYGSVFVQLMDRPPGMLIARVQRISGVVCYRFVVER